MIQFPAKPLARASVLAVLLLAGCASDVGRSGAPLAVAPSPLAPSEPAGSYGLFLSGQAAAAQGDLSRAANLFAQASANAPDESYLRAKAFSIMLLAGQVDRAAAIAAQGPVSGDETVTGLAVLTRAVEDIAEGRGKEALTSLSDKPGLGPHAVAAALLRPWAAAQAGDWKTAMAPAGPNADKIVLAFGGLGRAQLLERGGRLGNAEAVLKTMAASREPLFVLAYGGFLERRGRSGDAAGLYNQALARAAEDVTLLEAKARVSQHKAAPALPTLKEGPAQALINLAALLVADHQSDVGLSYLRLALKLDPDRADAWVLAGETLSPLGDTAGSRLAFNQVKPTDPSYPSARVRLALSYQQAGDKPQALKVAKETLAIRPEDQPTKVVYAELLRDSEHFDEAISLLTQIIDRPGAKGGDARLYYLRGANEERAGRWPEAEADLRKSLKLAPNEPDVLNYLGFAWVDRGEHLKEALDMLQRAVALAPDSGPIIDSLGWARYRLKDYAGATRDLERAVYLDAGDPEINDHLGDAYWRVGRRTEATYQWRQVLTLSPDAKLKEQVETKIRQGLPEATPSPSPGVASRTVSTPAGKGR